MMFHKPFLFFFVFILWITCASAEDSGAEDNESLVRDIIFSSYNPYEIVSFTMADGPEESDAYYEQERKVETIKKAVEERLEAGRGDKVRQKAGALASTYPGATNIDQICAIYSFLIGNWSYISDWRGLDYFQYANLTLEMGKNASPVRSGVGDCDDFAILMCAMIESIGGATRIVMAEDPAGRGGHVYAEVYLGRRGADDESINRIIRWLRKNYNKNDIKYDKPNPQTGEVWLNLDWNTTYPGGPPEDKAKNMPILLRTDSGKQYMRPANEPPMVTFSWEPKQPKVNEPVRFSAEGSQDFDGSIKGYYWDFGDGKTSSRMIEYHAYRESKPYRVRLTVTDNKNAKNSTEISLPVLEPDEEDEDHGSLFVKAAANGWESISQSRGYSDLPDAKATIFTAENSNLSLTFCGEAWTDEEAGDSHWDNDRMLTLRALVDDQPADPPHIIFAYGAYKGVNSYTFTRENLPAGPHQIRIQWGATRRGYMGNWSLSVLSVPVSSLGSCLAVKTALGGPDNPDVSTASSRWSDIPDMIQKIDTAKDSDLEITFSGEGDSEIDKNFYIRALVDGRPAEPLMFPFCAGRLEDYTGTRSFVFIKKNLSEGIHSLRIQWLIENGGTASLGDRTLSILASPSAGDLPRSAMGLAAKSTSAKPATMISTASASWANISDMSSAICNEAERSLKITFSGDVQASKGKKVELRALVDGLPASPPQLSFAMGGYNGSRFFIFVQEGLKPGMHQVQMQWLVEPGGYALMGGRTLSLTVGQKSRLEVRSGAARGDFNWTNRNFAVLLDGEEISSRIDQVNRLSGAAPYGLVYATKAQFVPFKFSGWGDYYRMGFLTQDYCVGLLLNSSRPIDDQVPWQRSLSLQKRCLLHSYQLARILKDDNRRCNITWSEPLKLGEGYLLSIADIDMQDKKVVLQLFQDGSYIESKAVSFRSSDSISNQTYCYQKDVGDVAGLVIIALHVADVKLDGDEAALAADGLWQISEEPFFVNPTDQFGVMTVEDVDGDEKTITMINIGATIVLEKDIEMEIAYPLMIRTEGSDELEYYIYKNLE
ncbi:MAG: S-layer protein domain-containing protein [Methanothrix sp.]|nr:S-layer protein domain-containing protein [Methanothrix sp.]